MKRLPGSVWVLGIVSLFNDMASEMLYPVLPIFITQVLGAPVAVLGLIDGVAEGSAALFKTIFGRWSDRLGKRKPFVFYGYLASTVSKVVIALSRTWGLVFVGRVLDKFVLAPGMPYYSMLLVLRTVAWCLESSRVWTAPARSSGP
jgi:MFS family permease